MDAATKTGLNALKTATKKVVHEESEATGKFIGKKITDQLTNQNLSLMGI